MNYDYPQKLLQLYKASYPDYHSFEQYAYEYRYGCDPIRLKLIKSYTRNCTFESVWNILENGSPELSRLRQTDYNKYSRLRSITVQNLKSYFKTMDNFTDILCTDSYGFDSAMKRIVKKSVEQL